MGKRPEISSRPWSRQTSPVPLLTTYPDPFDIIIQRTVSALWDKFLVEWAPVVQQIGEGARLCAEADVKSRHPHLPAQPGEGE